MTAAKMLTGQDMAISNMEIMLTSTYHATKERFRVQQEKEQRSKTGRRKR